MILLSLVSGSVVWGNGNSHSDETGDDGSDGTENESNGSSEFQVETINGELILQFKFFICGK